MANKAKVEDEIRKVTASVALNDNQVERIVSFPTYRWAKDGYQQCVDKIKELTKQYKEYVRLLKNPDDIKGIFISELDELKKVKFK